MNFEVLYCERSSLMVLVIYSLFIFFSSLAKIRTPTCLPAIPPLMPPMKIPINWPMGPPIVPIAKPIPAPAVAPVRPPAIVTPPSSALRLNSFLVISPFLYFL